MKKVEMFLRPMGCACTGGVTSLREQEEYSRMELLMDILEDYPEQVELHTYYLVDDSTYGESLRKLAGYLRAAGEEDFADRIAFSLKHVTPAVVVDGVLKYMREVPDIDGFLRETGIEETG